jgi:hypothetical protein
MHVAVLESLDVSHSKLTYGCSNQLSHRSFDLSMASSIVCGSHRRAWWTRVRRIDWKGCSAFSAMRLKIRRDTHSLVDKRMCSYIGSWDQGQAPRLLENPLDSVDATAERELTLVVWICPGQCEYRGAHQWCFMRQVVVFNLSEG